MSFKTNAAFLSAASLSLAMVFTSVTDAQARNLTRAQQNMLVNSCQPEQVRPGVYNLSRCCARAFTDMSRSQFDKFINTMKLNRSEVNQCCDSIYRKLPNDPSKSFLFFRSKDLSQYPQWCPTPSAPRHEGGGNDSPSNPGGPSDPSGPSGPSDSSGPGSAGNNGGGNNGGGNNGGGSPGDSSGSGNGHGGNDGPSNDGGGRGGDRGGGPGF